MLRTLLPFLSNSQSNSFVNFMIESKNFIPKLEFESVSNSKPHIPKSCLRRKRVLEPIESMKNSDERVSIDKSRNHIIMSTIENTENINRFQRVPVINIEKFTSSQPREHLLNSSCDFIKLKDEERCFGGSSSYTSFANYEEKRIIEERLNSSKPFSKWFVNDLNSAIQSEIENFTELSTNANATNQLNTLGRSFSMLPVVPLKGSLNKKKTKAANQRSKSNQPSNNNKTHTCELCNKVLPNQNSLGGHMRSYHPGKSEKYNKKKETEKKHEGRRLLNREAKRILEEKFQNYTEPYSRQGELKKIKRELKSRNMID